MKLQLPFTMIYLKRNSRYVVSGGGQVDGGPGGKGGCAGGGRGGGGKRDFQVVAKREKSKKR